MGRAGRRWVLAERNVDAQAEKLAQLVLHGLIKAPDEDAHPALARD
jgi:hypothetical protein